MPTHFLACCILAPLFAHYVQRTSAGPGHPNSPSSMVQEEGKCTSKQTLDSQNLSSHLPAKLSWKHMYNEDLSGTLSSHLRPQLRVGNLRALHNLPNYLQPLCSAPVSIMGKGASFILCIPCVLTPFSASCFVFKIAGFVLL